MIEILFVHIKLIRFKVYVTNQGTDKLKCEHII
jgi:hypothetical protein